MIQSFVMEVDDVPQSQPLAAVLKDKNVGAMRRASFGMKRKEGSRTLMSVPALPIDEKVMQSTGDPDPGTPRSETSSSDDEKSHKKRRRLSSSIGKLMGSHSGSRGRKSRAKDPSESPRLRESSASPRFSGRRTTQEEDYPEPGAALKGSLSLSSVSTPELPRMNKRKIEERVSMLSKKDKKTLTRVSTVHKRSNSASAGRPGHQRRGSMSDRSHYQSTNSEGGNASSVEHIHEKIADRVLADVLGELLQHSKEVDRTLKVVLQKTKDDLHAAYVERNEVRDALHSEVDKLRKALATIERRLDENSHAIRRSTAPATQGNQFMANHRKPPRKSPRTNGEYVGVPLEEVATSQDEDHASDYYEDDDGCCGLPCGIL